MKFLNHLISKLICDKKGATGAEYAVIMGMIAATAVGALLALGDRLGVLLEKLFG